MKKSTRQVIAKDTLSILERGHYNNSNNKSISVRKLQKKAEANTKLYRPDDFDALIEGLAFANDFETQYKVVPDTTLDAVRNLAAEGLENIFCLNFASAKNPGGGFMNGANAQEESVARASGLYPCLLIGRPYYEFHRKLKTCLYSDHMIYAPAVPVIKLESGELMDEPLPVSVLTSPAVNAGVVLRNEPKNVDKIIPFMERRIARMLSVALANGHETLVLGAWGCGVFRNDPAEIARLYQEALEGQFKGQFKQIVFAVYARDPRFITPFQERFA